MRKRAVSLALCLCMVLSLLLPPVLAVGKHPFTDVAATDWFNDSVAYVYERDLMKGTSDTTFAPYRTAQRGMIVTILHRLEGTPAVASGNPFTDVPRGSNYENAIIWASEKGIVTGYDGSTFGPYNDVTRQQMAAILYRYAQMKGYDTSESANLGDYADSSQISNYARTAMAWANGAGLINGNSDKQLMPTGNATRAQTAAILTRFCQNVVPIIPPTGGSGVDNGNTDDENTSGDTGATELPPPTPTSYTVTFDLNYSGGGIYQTLDVKAGEKIAAPTKPTRNNYSFLGWYTAATGGSRFNFKKAINAITTLYARWSKISSGGGSSSGGGGGNYTPVTNYTVTFISDGNVISVQTVVSGNRATAPANPAKEGYTFDGWFANDTASSPYDFNSAITSNLTLTARWRNEGSFTVAFYTDAETVLSRQTVKAGEQATEPEKPTREGQQFDGWFTSLNNQTGVTKYDFSSAVTADISLYAKWSVPQDFSDHESVMVTDSDSFVLSASERDIKVGTSVAVKFYVNSTLTVSSFELLLDEATTGVSLYDNGAYDETGDDIPNDGVYTGIYSINVTDAKDLIFTATTTVGTTPITTNEYDITVYSELTDEQIAPMYTVEESVSSTITSITESMGDSDLDALISAIRESLDAQLAQYVESGIIENVQYHESGYAYSWVYTNSGLETTYFIYDKFAGEDVLSNQSAVENRSTRARDPFLLSHNSLDTNAVLNADISINANYSKGNVTFLSYFSSGSGYGDYNDEMQSLENAGFNTTSVYQFTCDDFKNLQIYNSLILILSHGDTEYGGENDTPMICTDETVTSARDKHYSSDLKGKKPRIKRVNGKYWIYPALFEHYYQDNPLSNPIVYLGMCRNYPIQTNNEAMVKAIKGAGASVVCGYSATVSVTYNSEMVETFVNRLLLGDTVENAINAAKAAHTQSDHGHFDTDWNRRAELNSYGDNTDTLYHALRNGNIDQTIFGIYFPLSVYAWQEYGDARTIAKLAGIKPDTSPRMAIISSGFGSRNDETTSSIYQTFLVSESDSTIEFKYDVVSEEPMEYIGTEFNDIFQVDLLSTDGSVLETLAFESVNTSEWNPITRIIPIINTQSGDFFPGGDDTTYHTGWKSVSSDVLKKYQGQLVVLRFTVQDAGDSVYDTAALIDSVVIK